LRVLRRLSYQDVYDWLVAWTALALACGLPRDVHGRPCVPSPAQQWKQAARAGAPVAEALFVVLVRLALHRRLPIAAPAPVRMVGGGDAGRPRRRRDLLAARAG
jgi:hypothetical protein